jgi:hypothetical protein
MQPVRLHHPSATLDAAALSGPLLSGPFRLLDINGRRGLHALSINSFLRLPAHTLNENAGSLTLWLCPLDDLSARANHENHAQFDPNHCTYTIIADQPGPKDNSGAAFKIAWDSGWNPQFYCSFVKGKYSWCWNKPREAEFDSGFLILERGSWYQIGCSWNRAESRYRLSVNGVLAATSDIFETPLVHDPAGPSLYAGNPSWAMADFCFYAKEGDARWFAGQFEADRRGVRPESHKTIERVFIGRELPALKWAPDSSWTGKLNLSLTDSHDLKHFYIQGKQDGHWITPDGLRGETHPDKIRTEDMVLRGGKRNLWAMAKEPHSAWSRFDQWQVYFWTWQVFEGDLAVEYDFMPLDNDGLSLLIVQASGLQREDFMKDYPLRVSGHMSLIHQEDVRNYHWEYYREIADSRQDVANSALFKNPWLHPLAFQCQRERAAKNQWHRLRFLQEGARLRGSIDGEQLFDVTDRAFINQGPVLRNGHIAIRCMCQTKMMFRNLRVWNRNTEFSVLSE